MKKFNDHIIVHYESILFPQGTSEDTEEYGHKVSLNAIICNDELLRRAKEEIAFSDQKDKDPKQFLRECVRELEQQGFLSLDSECDA